MVTATFCGGCHHLYMAIVVYVHWKVTVTLKVTVTPTLAALEPDGHLTEAAMCPEMIGDQGQGLVA